MAGRFSYSHFTGGFTGSQAGHIGAPHGDTDLLELLGDLPDEKGQCMSGVLAMGYHAVRDTRVYPQR